MSWTGREKGAEALSVGRKRDALRLARARATAHKSDIADVAAAVAVAFNARDMHALLQGDGAERRVAR